MIVLCLTVYVKFATGLFHITIQISSVSCSSDTEGVLLIFSTCIGKMEAMTYQRLKQTCKSNLN